VSGLRHAACVGLCLGIEFYLMESARPKLWRTAAKFLLAILLVLFGFLIATAGYQSLRNWASISVGYAAFGVLWVVVGPVMLAGGLWVLGSLGRNQIPLWIGGAAALLSGGSLIAGVVTYVVPCSGPS